MKYKSRLQRVLVVVIILVLLTSFSNIFSSKAKADSGVQFPIMNASGGVWFRNTPNINDTDRVTGHGVYNGNMVLLICYAQGDGVGSYGNTLWYYAVNLTTPIIPTTGSVNEGYINAHYVNDNMSSNQVDAGVPQCNGSVYYSPFDTNNIATFPVDNEPSFADVTLYKYQWTSSTHCMPYLTNGFSSIVNNKKIMTLAGWSIGRMGPIGYLRDFPDKAHDIHYIILFDPGALGELQTDCDEVDISQTLANWLNYNPLNRLLIMAGKVTRDQQTAIGPYAHQGLQEVYFPAIHGTSAASQVSVCNYDSMSHPDVFIQFRGLMLSGPFNTNTCPTAPNGTASNTPFPWHP